VRRLPPPFSQSAGEGRPTPTELSSQKLLGASIEQPLCATPYKSNVSVLYISPAVPSQRPRSSCIPDIAAVAWSRLVLLRKPDWSRRSSSPRLDIRGCPPCSMPRRGPCGVPQSSNEGVARVALRGDHNYLGRGFKFQHSLAVEPALPQGASGSPGYWRTQGGSMTARKVARWHSLSHQKASPDCGTHNQDPWGASGRCEKWSPRSGGC